MNWRLKSGSTVCLFELLLRRKLAATAAVAHGCYKRASWRGQGSGARAKLTSGGGRAGVGCGCGEARGCLRWRLGLGASV
jgi:hypothetical protein